MRRLRGFRVCKILNPPPLAVNLSELVGQPGQIKRRVLAPPLARFFRTHLVNSKHGSLAEKVRWDVEILTPKRDSGFWDDPSEDKMEVVVPRTPLHSLRASAAQKTADKAREAESEAK